MHHDPGSLVRMFRLEARLLKWILTPYLSVSTRIGIKSISLVQLTMLKGEPTDAQHSKCIWMLFGSSRDGVTLTSFVSPL